MAQVNFNALPLTKNKYTPSHIETYTEIHTHLCLGRFEAEFHAKRAGGFAEDHHIFKLYRSCVLCPGQCDSVGWRVILYSEDFTGLIPGQTTYLS